MITTNKIVIKYTQKEIRRKSKHFSIKNEINTKEESNLGIEKQK